MKLRIREDRWKTATVEKYLSVFWVEKEEDFLDGVGVSKRWVIADDNGYNTLEAARHSCNLLMNPPPIVMPVIVIHDYP